MKNRSLYAKRMWIFISLFFYLSALQSVACWAAGPNHQPNYMLQEITEIKNEDSLPVPEKAGRINHVLYRLSNKELLSIIELLNMKTPVYQTVAVHQSRDNHAKKMNKVNVQLAILDCISHPEQKQQIVSMLSNYILNSSEY